MDRNTLFGWLDAFVQEHLGNIFKDSSRVLLGGSHCLDFILHPRDVDIVVVLDPKVPVNDLFCRGYPNKMPKTEADVAGEKKILDFHYRKENVNEYGGCVDCWISHYNIPLWPKNQNAPFNGFDVPFVEKHREELKEEALRCLDREGKIPYVRKALYYAYGLSCVFSHRSFEFTPEEKKMMNALHDRDGGVDKDFLIRECRMAFLREMSSCVPAGQLPAHIP